MLVSPKDENRSEAVRAEKARLFLEQFIEIEAEWISDWLSMENGETFGADMALLTLEKYRWDNGYHFDKVGVETAITLFRDMLGGELAAGIVKGRTQTNLPWPSDLVEANGGRADRSVWFHDLIDDRGVPYDPSEVSLIGSLTSATNQQRTTTRTT